MATLYRKYRPQRFAEVVGQNHIKITLEQELKSGRLAHSYLFCGPRAVGKTTLARVLAKALNCLQRRPQEAEPCNTCRACQEITAGSALDIMEIDAASHTGVDNVRENIIASARVRPSSLQYKIFIIDEVHMLSTPAFNALLKMMEEPPEYVVFILCTTEVHKIPLTIISRCQRFDFKKIGVGDIVKKLTAITAAEKISVDDRVLESIARHAGGHMRDAESTLGQIISLAEPLTEGGRLTISVDDAALVIPRDDLAEVMNLLEALLKKDAAGAVRLINRLTYDGFDLKIFTANIIEILRQLLLIKINPDLVASLGVDLGESLEERLVAISNQVNINQLLKYLERFARVQQELKDSAIIQLPLEMAAAELTLETAAATAAARPAAAQAPVTTGAARSATVSLEEVLAKWSEFLIRVKRVNHSLSFVLKVCQPIGVEGSDLCLAFKHKIHKDRISETEIKRLVEEVLQEVYNQELFIKAILDENLAISDSNPLDNNNSLSNNNGQNKPTPANDEAINNILKNFGGKIVG